jgi:hypothetical protein
MTYIPPAETTTGTPKPSGPATPERVSDRLVTDFYDECAAWQMAEEVADEFERAARKFAGHLDEADVGDVTDRLRSDIGGSIGGAVERAFDELVALEADAIA